MDGSVALSPDPRRPTLAELLRRSDFARARPDLADAILDRVADPTTESRNVERSRD